MFQRYSYSSEYLLAYLSYRKKINKHNIDKLSSYKINKILQNEDPQIRFLYLHNVLFRFNKSYYKEDYIYLDKLKKIINKHKIILNTQETQFLYLLEERIFTRIRTLKILDSYYPFLKNENLYARYKKGKVYFLDKDRYKTIIHGELLLTNKRIIIKAFEKQNDYEFYYNQMTETDLTSYGFEFYYGKEKVLIRTHDQLTLCNMIRRFQKNKWLSNK